METFRFANPDFLYLLFVIPLIALLMLYFYVRARKSMNAFGQRDLILHLMPDYSARRLRFKAFLLLLAFTLQVFVLARPQFGVRGEVVKRKGIELMFAFDLSNSMNAADVAPSRIQLGKSIMSKVVDGLSNDKVGLVVFAGVPYLQLPMTVDNVSSKFIISELSTDMVETQGTAIGSAINMCVNSFSDIEGINRAIVVISDGENHEDDAKAAAAAAAQKGIMVFTVGLGTERGAPVPAVHGSNNDFIKDKDGNVAISRINPQMLYDVAAAAGGMYVSGNSMNCVSVITDALQKIEKSEYEAKSFAEYKDYFPHIQLMVLLIVLADMLLLGRRNRRLAGFNIFTRKREEKDLFILQNNERN